MNEKLILDACCGGRQFWFDKENPNVLFADRRVMPPTPVGNGKDRRIRKCLPDKVMDFRSMDLADNSFRLVVFDPPHLFLGENSFMAQSYGTLDKNNWQEDLRKGFKECFRVLEDKGILIFKWNECDVPLKEVLMLTDQKPLFGHPSGKAQKTHWVCFMKRTKEKEMERGICRECGYVELNILIEDGVKWGLCEKCGQTVIEIGEATAEELKSHGV